MNNIQIRHCVLLGDSGEATRDKVIENFDARARRLGVMIIGYWSPLRYCLEGVNLHRSNTVINYDIPWNPTRMMQRAGRATVWIRYLTRFIPLIFSPTKQSNDEIKLKEAAEAKINAFNPDYGDAELLTEGEPIGSHELFDKLISRQTLEGEEGAEERIKISPCHKKRFMIGRP